MIKLDTDDECLGVTAMGMNFEDSQSQELLFHRIAR